MGRLISRVSENMSKVSNRRPNRKALASVTKLRQRVVLAVRACMGPPERESQGY